MVSEVIQPQTISKATHSKSQPIKRKRSSCSINGESDTTPRKNYRRVSKACERCRLKKIKCDGEIPCRRCTDDMVICREGIRKKGAPKTVAESCLELLEYQQTKFIAGHIKMYKMMVDARIWTFGEVRKNHCGMPVVHDILEKLGVMRFGIEFPKSFPESPDENRALRLQIEATKSQEIRYSDRDEFQRRVTESSSPSLIYTDRESSTETFNSGAHSIVEINSDAMTPGQPMIISGFQQDLDISYWNLHTVKSGKKEKSVIAHFNPASYPSNNSNYNHISQDISEVLINSNLRTGSGFDIDHPIVISSSPVQSMPQFSTQIQSKNGVSFDSRTSFNNQQNFVPTKILQPLGMNLEIVPQALEDVYDPYMG